MISYSSISKGASACVLICTHGIISNGNTNKTPPFKSWKGRRGTKVRDWGVSFPWAMISFLSISKGASACVLICTHGTISIGTRSCWCPERNGALSAYEDAPWCTFGYRRKSYHSSRKWNPSIPNLCPSAALFGYHIPYVHGVLMTLDGNPSGTIRICKHRVIKLSVKSTVIPGHYKPARIFIKCQRSVFSHYG